MFNEKLEQLLRALAASYIPVAASICADKAMLLCPVCHHENVHPIAVRVVPAGRAPWELLVTSAGLRLDPTIAPTGRGVVITLSFLCEEGHAFEYELAFRKGSSLIRREIGSGSPNGVPADTIWRD